MSLESWVARSRSCVASSTTKSGKDGDSLHTAFRELGNVLGALDQKSPSDRTSVFAESFHAFLTHHSDEREKGCYVSYNIG